MAAQDIELCTLHLLLPIILAKKSFVCFNDGPNMTSS